MGIMGTILGIIIGINIVFAIVDQNWFAAAGWFVAFLEWTRRFTLN